MQLHTETKPSIRQFLIENKIPHRYGWNNYMGTVYNKNAVLVDIDSIKQLQKVLRYVKELNKDKNEANKITVRATAGWADREKVTCEFFKWDKVQEEKYNEGFSFSQVVGGKASPDSKGTDIILRFTKNFHSIKMKGRTVNSNVINPNNPIHKLNSYLVEVSAGVQIAELADFLHENKCSLTTVSMIAWVTPMGLSGTGGHGTGRDEPAFSGLIEEMEVCDMDAEIRTLTKENPNFKALVGGHSGLLGIGTKLLLRVVEEFKLREDVELFHNCSELEGKLGDILHNNHYVSIMGMPSFTKPEIDKMIHKIQIRKWNYSEEKRTRQDKDATYSPNIGSLTQELEIKVGGPLMDFLINSGLQRLLPYYMLFSAATVAASRGTAPVVDFESHITHPQVSFPKTMHDVSYIFPVKDAVAGKTLSNVMKKIEQIAMKYAKEGKCPITYAYYVRYYKGTNGGLSTSYTCDEDERVLAVDIVTHPFAPGREEFEQEFVAALKEMGINPRYHLGKNFPEGVDHYDQFLDKKSLLELNEALVDWHKTDTEDGAKRFAMSPFVTPYLKKMLTPSSQLKDELVVVSENMQMRQEIKPKMQPRQYTDRESSSFLTVLMPVIKAWPTQSEEAAKAKQVFLEECKEEQRTLTMRMHATNNNHVI